MRGDFKVAANAGRKKGIPITRFISAIRFSVDATSLRRWLSSRPWPIARKYELLLPAKEGQSTPFPEFNPHKYLCV